MFIISYKLLLLIIIIITIIKHTINIFYNNVNDYRYYKKCLWCGLLSFLLPHLHVAVLLFLLFIYLFFIYITLIMNVSVIIIINSLIIIICSLINLPLRP